MGRGSDRQGRRDRSDFCVLTNHYSPTTALPAPSRPALGVVEWVAARTGTGRIARWLTRAVRQAHRSAFAHGPEQGRMGGPERSRRAARIQTTVLVCSERRFLDVSCNGKI